MNNQPLTFPPLAEITKLSKRGRHNFIKRQELFVFRLSSWFALGHLPAQPAEPQGGLSN
ncbi:MAG: hypothetical protein ACRC52_00135 [Aeromonas veronii]